MTTSATHVRTDDPSGKVRRIRNHPDVERAPGTARGRTAR